MKLELGNIRKIYFLGLGGIGMSALARYFHTHGVEIHGYDKTPTVLTSELIEEGMQLHFEDDPALIPADIDLVIYTPAVPRTLNEFRTLDERGIPIMKRAQVTGLISVGKTTVAVAGTHGKTSISSMTAHVLKQAGFPVTALIGGISKNYNSNFISSGKEEIMVVEADEYDRSFLSLHPDIAVISAIDADHLDIYGSVDEVKKSFNDFAKNIMPGGILVARNGLAIDFNPDTGLIHYAVDEKTDFSAENLRISNNRQVFDLRSEKINRKEIYLQVPGRHNIENALASIAVCNSLGVEEEAILTGIQTFTGVRRRFDIRIQDSGRVYIDDYAHHPRELEAFISAVRQLYPGKRITGLFQPHLYTRTRDFAAGFAKSLDLLDEAWLMDIYPARELPIPGVSSQLILDLMQNPGKKLVSGNEVLALLERNIPDVFLTMGAGDIDLLVEPVTKILEP